MTNFTLIGMAGAGKSTIGKRLAKALSLGFLDSDQLIELSEQQSLQQIVDRQGYRHLREIEAREILKINVQYHVIATGGSAVYSPAAMAHLATLSTRIFLQVNFAEIQRRMSNFSTRGLAKAKNQSLRDLFEERQVLYHQYADLTINCTGFDQAALTTALVKQLK